MSLRIVADLRANFGIVRDQFERPTCLAFAVSDAHAATRSVVWTPLSCEYLFYHAIRRDGGSPESGATPESTLAAVSKDGQPHEASWPYLVESPNAADWTPPDAVGELFYRDGKRAGAAFDAVWQLLESGRPSVIAMLLSDSFYQPTRTGVLDSTEIPDRARRHAVVAVAGAWQENTRLVLVRNSWGVHWGTGGHMWLTERYLVDRIQTVIELKKES